MVDMSTQNDIFVLQNGVASFDHPNDVGSRTIAIERIFGPEANDMTRRHGFSFEGIETFVPFIETATRSGEQLLSRLLADKSDNHPRSLHRHRVGVFGDKQQPFGPGSLSGGDFGLSPQVFVPHLQRIDILPLIRETAFAQHDLTGQVHAFVVVVPQLRSVNPITDINQLPGRFATVGEGRREIIFPCHVVLHHGIFPDRIVGLQETDPLHIAIGLGEGIFIRPVISFGLDAPLHEVVDHKIDGHIIADIARTTSPILIRHQGTCPLIDVCGRNNMERFHHFQLLLTQGIFLLSLHPGETHAQQQSAPGKKDFFHVFIVIWFCWYFHFFKDNQGISLLSLLPS